MDSLLAKNRTLAYEYERLTKSHAQRNLQIARVETEMQGWKARCVDLERRLGNEENKVKELREEAGRGKKALETVRVAAGVSGCDCNRSWLRDSTSRKRFRSSSTKPMSSCGS